MSDFIDLKDSNGDLRCGIWQVAVCVDTPRIGDHDIALSVSAPLRSALKAPRSIFRTPNNASGYVLEHFQKALPSFAGLSKSQQDSIRFTHCHLD